MRDGPVRQTVKLIARTCNRIDLRVTRKLRPSTGRLRYRLAGTCNGCGQCCESPMIKPIRVVAALQFATVVFLWWQRVVNGFAWVRTDHKKGIFVFNCTHYDPETKLCDSYQSRPGMCRDYPQVLFDAPIPRFLPDCSYYAVDRRAAGFKALLEGHQIPSEKREKLYRDLNLVE